MQDARKFFAENLRILGLTTPAAVQQNPEKYNLSLGLVALAEQTAETHRLLPAVHRQLQMLGR